MIFPLAFITQSTRPTSSSKSTSPFGSLRRLTFAAMGTNCEVQYVAPKGETQAGSFEAAAVSWVQAFEAKYTRFRPTSLIGRINAAAGASWVNIDEDMEQMMKLCDALYLMTQGVLDPTALPLLRLWDWKIENPALPTADAIATARSLVGWSKVQRAPGKVFLPEPGMALDFGGFGKEYAVDMVAQIALNHDISDALIDFGHDLRALGSAPGRPAWHIGLEDPSRPGASWSSVALSGSRGIASSGDYVRCFRLNGKRYGHIVDPRTGWPVANGCIQTTAIAGTCLHAGVLSTTSFVLGAARGIDFIQAFPDAQGLILTEKSRFQTRGFHNYVVA
ncbi:MAG TPA: FAD:protein FMN transferase [Candidatus Didemnitutus sp.]|nr:FAD:protein FMN transferase [Candidatus Didemnitutus sp.]